MAPKRDHEPGTGTRSPVDPSRGLTPATLAAARAGQVAAGPVRFIPCAFRPSNVEAERARLRPSETIGLMKALSLTERNYATCLRARRRRYRLRHPAAARQDSGRAGEHRTVSPSEARSTIGKLRTLAAHTSSVPRCRRREDERHEASAAGADRKSWRPRARLRSPARRTCERQGRRVVPTVHGTVQARPWRWAHTSPPHGRHG